MSNTYYQAMSNIKLEKEEKEQLVQKLEKYQKLEKKKVVRKKGGIMMKIKRLIIGILSALAMLIGSGAVYAALGGTINGIPAIEWLGIKFSKNYQEYVDQ